MARYILIDSHSGYIWGDSADLNGSIFTGSPVEFARALDESVGEHGRRYEEVSRHELSGHTGYHVYRADVGGSEAVPVVQDGQDQEMIEAVERDCEYVTAIRVHDAIRLGDRVEAGAGEDHDTGRVIEPTDADMAHPMAAGPNVLVAWDSGTRTWAPLDDLRPA